MKNTIFHHNKSTSNPYYIFAPSYVDTSAGVKVMHALCHHLNLKGYPAFIANTKESRYKTNPNLITPIATSEVLEMHKRCNKTPIAVYPDVVNGNPLDSKCIVRYLLHYAGFLGGDSSFDKSDLIFTYTKKIGHKMGIKNPQTLFMPISDTEIFFPPQDNKKRSGSCFYASKYRVLSGQDTLNTTSNSVEITRNLPNSQTTQGVANLLRTSEYFYSYEDSSLITESILCGCPVILIKNEFFDEEPLAINELGDEGTTLNSDLENIEQARKSIPLAQEKFFKAIEDFYPQLDEFIKLTQLSSKKFDGEKCDIKLFEIKKKSNPIGRIIKNKVKSLLRKG